MKNYPTKKELEHRILKHLETVKGNTEKMSVCWDGYLAALLEWGLISVQDHAELVKLLPNVENNPVNAIFLGV